MAVVLAGMNTSAENGTGMRCFDPMSMRTMEKKSQALLIISKPEDIVRNNAEECPHIEGKMGLTGGRS